MSGHQAVTCPSCIRVVSPYEKRCPHCGKKIKRADPKTGKAAKKYDSKHVQHFWTKHIKTNEEIKAWAEGYIGQIMGKGDKTQHNGALIVTDQRVAFCRKGFLGEILETIPLKKISSIEKKSFLGHYAIRLHTSHDELEFKTFDAQKNAELYQAIEEGRSIHQQESQAIPEKKDTNNDHPLELLKKLGGLKEAGIITEDEFLQKKEDLLKRI